MAPAAVMTTAAATAALIALYGKTIATVAGAVIGGGTAVWTLTGFRKIQCPACARKINLRDYMDHASTHTFQCPSCSEQVPFSEMVNHAQRHGFLCVVCTETIPLADFDAHLDLHRAEDAESRRTKDEAYQDRLRALDREFEKRVQDLQRTEDDYNERREQVNIFWGYLKAECPLCKRDICIRDIESHLALHGLELKPSTKRAEELANIKGTKGPRAKGFRIAALMKRWGGRQ